MLAQSTAQRPGTPLGGPRRCTKVCNNANSTLNGPALRPAQRAQPPDQHWAQLNFAPLPSCLDFVDSQSLPLSDAPLSFGSRRQAGPVLVASTRALKQKQGAAGTNRQRVRGAVRCRGIPLRGAVERAELQPAPAQRLLLPSDEVELARAVQRGRGIEREAAALMATTGGQAPTPLQLAQAAGYECAKAMEEALQKGWAARQRLVDCNRGLVVRLARKLRGLGLAIEDLISEGTAALERAALDFNPERRARFSTFAGTVIFRGMLRAVYSYGRTMPLPEHMHLSMQQVLGAKQRLLLFLGREPTPGEIAQEAGLTLAELQRLQHAFKQPTLALVRAAALGSGRLEEVDGEDVEAHEGEEDGADLFRVGIMLDVAIAVQALKPDQRTAVVLRNGLAGAQPHTWKQVAGALQLTHQRAHKIHEAAIQRLQQQLVA